MGQFFQRGSSKPSVRFATPLQRNPQEALSHDESTTHLPYRVWSYSLAEQTQIHLPLKAVECRFNVSGAAVDVQIDQVFHQPGNFAGGLLLHNHYRCEDARTLGRRGSAGQPARAYPVFMLAIQNAGSVKVIQFRLL
jgi:hypothetical protein